MSIQRVELALPFGADIPSIHCPVCGAVLQQPDAPVELPTCKHLEFAYVDIIGPDFLYIKPRLLDQLKKWAEETPDEDIEGFETLVERLDSRTMMLLTVTSSGMGCGPTSVTASYAINFQE